MLGDLVASADPDLVVAQDVIDETGKRGGARRLAGETACRATVIILGVCSPSRWSASKLSRSETKKSSA